MKKTVLKIEGMSCSACSNGLEKYLNKQSGIKKANVNLVMASAYIEHDNNITIDMLNEYVENAGFKSLGIYNEKEDDKEDNSKIFLIIFGVLLIIVMFISMTNYISNKGIILFFISLVFIYYGYDLIKSGIKNLIHLMPNMDTLVTLSVISSMLYSVFNLISNNGHYFFESSCMVIYFVKLGRFIDSKSKEKTKEAIKGLVQITPDYAVKLDGSKITIDEVKKGDILKSSAGEKVSVDGIITKGSSYIDESFITGESSTPKRKVGDKVLAGSIVIDGLIEYEAVNIGKKSTISQIVNMVVESSSYKPNIQRLADTISGYFVPFVFIIAIISFIVKTIIFDFNIGFNTFVSVLVVSCPCALGLATPLAVVTSQGMCAKKGIFIKNGEILERAKDINTIIFDKTGTLTHGKLKIFKLFNYSNYEDDYLLKIISSIENNSNHPISNAFKSNSLFEVSSFKNISGIGIKGIINNNDYYIGSNKLFDLLKIKNKNIKDEKELLKDKCSIIYVIENKKVIALLGLMDTIKDSSLKLVNKLKSRSIDTIILSGDNEESVKYVSLKLGIDNYVSSCMPSDKEKYIKKLKSEGKTISMVGDGINDAPALALCDVGISVNSATDIAASSSDVLLMDNNLYKIINIIDISKKTTKIIKQNLFWAFFYNTIMITIAVISNINPMIASIFMTISSISVIINSLRLKVE